MLNCFDSPLIDGGSITNIVSFFRFIFSFKKTRQPRRAAKPQVYKDVFEESEGDEADGGQCDDSSVENSPSPVKKSKPKLARPLDEEFYQARDWRSTGVIDY